MAYRNVPLDNPDGPGVDIWRARLELQKTRQKKAQGLMDDYDKDIYLPAVQALRERCAAQGHRKAAPYITGLGWIWIDCALCGKRLESIGPDK